MGASVNTNVWMDEKTTEPIYFYIQYIVSFRWEWTPKTSYCQARGEHKKFWCFCSSSPLFVLLGFPFFHPISRQRHIHTHTQNLFPLFSHLSTLLVSLLLCVVYVCMWVSFIHLFIYFSVFIWSWSIFIHLRCNGICTFIWSNVCCVKCWMYLYVL